MDNAVRDCNCDLEVASAFYLGLRIYYSHFVLGPAGAGYAAQSASNTTGSVVIECFLGLFGWESNAPQRQASVRPDTARLLKYANVCECV